MLRDFIVSLYGETVYNVLAIIFKFYPLWLPISLGFIFWTLWIRYIRYLTFVNTQYSVIEIRLPKEIFKSPMAMELALSGFYQTGSESNVYDKFWLGKMRAAFSLEIAYINSEVRFFIWTRQNMRNIIESYLYSQYPGIEIREVEDYTKYVKYDPEKMALWAAHFKLLQANPLPIKTYVDYGLDRDPKEEFKNDPLAPVLEFLGSLKPQENVWLQFVIRAHKKERTSMFQKAEDWREEINNIRKEIIALIKESGRNVPTKNEGDLIDALERNFRKPAFDCGIRVIYMAPKDVFNGTTFTGLRNLMKPFSAPEWTDKKYPYAAFNGFKATNSTDWDYPWEDFMDIRLNYRKRKMIDSYKRRMFFYDPYIETSMILTTEELATLYHFPGMAAAAPNVPRIPSKRAQAPTNLPI